MMRLPPQPGFTLIEVMVTVAILGILASIALPSYNNYLRRGRVADAVTMMLTKTAQLEQFFQDNRTYVGGCTLTSSTYFDVNCATANLSATGFTVTATGKGSMAGFVYTVNQGGAKTTAVPDVSGWSASPSCWVLKQDGSC